ncbi:hypothetical protein BMF94_0605 [Rhodotorula taiwanensis]|uniref:Triacylglycerol lipase n=1 Tax=Rhodotorula taiwanensis TaxID=741276 RepID=A0A2S5BI16_9BASI|nr:hypothetical protein BMF94_0605 [Rhodotorula taiwanensis]
MSRLAGTAVFTLVLLHLVVAAPLAVEAASTGARLRNVDSAAGFAQGVTLERRATASSTSSGSTQQSAQDLLSMVVAAIGRLTGTTTNKAAGLSTKQRVSYSTLVAFGASYTDNAHWRSNANSGSLRNYAPWSTWGGRYSNGPVAVEYMVDPTVSPALPQNAYGGSVIQNGLDGTGASWPCSKDQVRAWVALVRSVRQPLTCLNMQVATYLADVSSGAVAATSGRTLLYFNTGINPVLAIFGNMLKGGSSAKAIAYAQAAVSNNVAALATSIRSLNTAPKSTGRDYLIVGIPQMDLVPVASGSIPSSYSTQQRQAALGQIQALTNQYNAELAAFAQAFQNEVTTGKVYWFDLAALWQSLTNSPASYGITQGTKTCVSGSGMCQNPSQYLYMDSLHPVTTVHKLWAQQMNALVAGSS